MLLECRNTSNTCHNLLKRGKCAINFIPDDKKYFKEAVRLGYPGPSEEKMKENRFTMEPGQADPEDKERPPVIAEAFQVFECTWNKELENAGKFNADDIDDGHPGPYNDFNGITSKYGAHFILNIDEALMNFVKVPRPFLKTVLNGCIAWAKENNVTLITNEHVKIINDKRRAEKEGKR